MRHQLRELLIQRNNILPEPISDQKHNKQNYFDDFIIF